LTCQKVRLAEGHLIDTQGRSLPVADTVATDRALAIHGGNSFDAITLWDGWELKIGAAAKPGRSPEVIA
jgi:hypothetical protein